MWHNNKYSNINFGESKADMETILVTNGVTARMCGLMVSQNMIG